MIIIARSRTLATPLSYIFAGANRNKEIADSAAEKKKGAPAAKKAQVPDFISIQLQPKTNTAWHRVSDIAQNPHLRVKVRCEQSLSTVVEAVEKKWVPSTVRFVSFDS